MKRKLCLTLMALHLAGCTTMNPVLHSGHDRTAALKVGDTIATTGRDGRASRFEIVRTTADEVCGPEECVRRSDIVGLEVQEFSAWKTTLLVAGVAAFVALAAVAGQGAAAAAALGGGR